MGAAVSASSLRVRAMENGQDTEGFLTDLDGNKHPVVYFGKTNQDALMRLAGALKMHVPRTAEYKWGWNLHLIPLEGGDCSKVLIRGNNEEWKNCEPSFPLESILEMKKCGDGIWRREDCTSHLVTNPLLDHNYMKILAKANENVAIDNLAKPYTSTLPILGGQTIEPKKSTAFALSDLNLMVGDFEVQNGSYLVQMGEKLAMRKYLYGESDPYSIMTTDLIGMHLSPEMKCKGIYENVLYRVVPKENGGPSDTMVVPLVAIWELGKGHLMRVDERSMLGGPYSKIAVFPGLNEDYTRFRKYGVDTENESGSRVWLEEIGQDTRVIEVPAKARAVRQPYSRSPRQ
jgi:hypothetical protein